MRVQNRDGKKDEDGNPLTKKGDIHPNIVGGYVDWFAVQRADLKNTKKLFPEYKQLDSQVFQDVINRVETSFARFTTPDITGKRSGKPRFKGKHYYKSLTYPQLDNSDVTKDERGRICVNLAKIGLVPVVFHRPLPDGFKVKTGTVLKEAEVKIAKLHQYIARSRLDFQFKLAYWIFNQCDVLFVEDLKLKNLTRRVKAKIDNEGTWLPNGQAAKSGLIKSLLDAAHGQFLEVLKYVAWKLGKTVVEVAPRGTSQHCWNCLNKVAKTLSDRWHSCPCGQELDRDYNSSKLIKKIGLNSNSGGGTPSLKNAFAKKEKEARVVTVLRSTSG